MQFCSLQATGFFANYSLDTYVEFNLQQLEPLVPEAGFYCRTEPKAPAKGAGISISSRVGDGGPSSVSTDSSKQQPTPVVPEQIKPLKALFGQISVLHKSQPCR